MKWYSDRLFHKPSPAKLMQFQRESNDRIYTDYHWVGSITRICCMPYETFKQRHIQARINRLARHTATELMILEL